MKGDFSVQRLHRSTLGTHGSAQGTREPTPEPQPTPGPRVLAAVWPLHRAPRRTWSELSRDLPPWNLGGLRAGWSAFRERVVLAAQGWGSAGMQGPGHCGRPESRRLRPGVPHAGVSLGTAAAWQAASRRSPGGLGAAFPDPGRPSTPVQDSVVPSCTCLAANLRAHQPGPCPLQLRDQHQDPALHHR